MDDFIEYVLAFGRHWKALMGGAASVILAAFAASTDVKGRFAFAAVSIVAFFCASFLVWREESSKAKQAVHDLASAKAKILDLETPKMSDADRLQDEQVRAQVAKMNHVLVDALFKIALSGAEAEHINGIKTIGQMTGFFRREGVMLYVQDGWRAPLRRWADEEAKRRATESAK